MQRTRLDPKEFSYREVERLIKKLCNKFARTYGGDFEDYLSESHVYFLKAWETHDYGRGAFTTWVWWQVRTGLMDYVKRQTREANHLRAFVEGYKEPGPASTFDVEALLAVLSADGQEVVRAVVNVPIDIQFTMKRRGSSWFHQRTATKEFFKDLGWTRRRLEAAFTEVREALEHGL